VDAEGGHVWALGQQGRDAYWLIGADARTGERIARIDRRGYPEGMAAGTTGVWVGESHPSVAVRVTGRPARVRMPAPAYLAAVGGTVWGVGDEGTVFAIDERSAKIVLRIPQLVQPVGSPGSGGHLLAADARGVWVGDPPHDQVVHVTREGIDRRLRVGPLPGPIAVQGHVLWAATGDSLRETFQLKRVDLRSGQVSGGIALGTHAPEALAPFDGGCWVVASDGTAMRVTG
jgi:hypothetical protein